MTARKSLTYVEVDVPLFIAQDRAVATVGDYVTRGGGLAGLVDGKQLTFSGWIYIESGNSARLIAGVGTGGGADARTRVALDATNRFFLFGNNAAVSTICDIRSSPLELGQWYHILCSVNLANPAQRHLYVNGVSDLAVVNTYINDTMDLTLGDWGILGYPDGTLTLTGGAADFWFDDTYIDFSVQANREKFIRNGKPVLMGFTGEKPTGTAPTIFMSGAEDIWHMNLGTGGGLTMHGEFGDGYFFPLNFTETFRFTMPADYLPHNDIEAFPLISSVSYTPAKISLGENLGQRASVQVNLQDCLHIFGEDGYNDGTFWGKWRGRYGTKLRAKNLRLIRGFLGQTLEAMDTRHYIIETTAGPSLGGGYIIEAKDVIKLADEDRAQAPFVSEGKLAGSINNVATTANLTPSGVGATYPTSGYVTIGGAEVVAFTRPGGDNPNTLILCHFDGADESTTAADFDSDGAFFARVATRQGNVKIDSAQSVFGGTSANFDGTGDFITYLDSNDWTFAGDFTIDAWVHVTNLGIIRTICSHGSGGDRWQFRVLTDGALQFFEIVSSVTTIVVSSSAATIAINNWYHVAVVRSGNVFRLFVNGMQVASNTLALSMTNFASTLNVGAEGGAEAWIGWIDEFRISNVARWTSNFTPSALAYGSEDVMTITRAQFGSVAQGHNSGDRIQLTIRYTGNTPADIIYDLLVNYANIPASYINLSEWQTEVNDFLGVIYAATITEPTSVRTLINELIEQAQLAVFWDERALKVRLAVLREIATDTDTFGDDRILQDSLQVNEQPGKRLSQQWTFYGQRDPTESVSDERNYRASLATIDLISETEYGTPEIVKTRCRWIETETAASRMNSIKTSRYKDPPRSFAFDLMVGENVSPAVGYLLEWWGNQSQFGTAIPAKIQVTQVTLHPDRVHIEAEEMLATGVVNLVNVVFLATPGSVLSWEVPADWNDADNSIDVIGGGGGGGGTGNFNGGGGGGGGAYSGVVNQNLTPGGFLSYRVANNVAKNVDGEDTWFGNAVYGSALVGAKGGLKGNHPSAGGDGGQAAAGIGTTKFSGGDGGNGAPRGDARAGGGGGGGAAGPHGDGGDGGNLTGSSQDGGSGGGGADGGSNGAVSSGGNGGAGGNNRFNFGGGAGGNPAMAGDEGGGGGGGDDSTPAAPGGAGEQLWTQTFAPITSAGPGGGGGGGGNSDAGADGGLYGGGGGGAGGNDSGAGQGKQGIIVITWREV